jgi:hypothetical protein
MRTKNLSAIAVVAKVDSIDGTGVPVIGTDHLVKLSLSLL